MGNQTRDLVVPAQGTDPFSIGYGPELTLASAGLQGASC